MKHSLFAVLTAFIFSFFSWLSPLKAVEFKAGDNLLGADMGLAFPTKLSPARAAMALNLEYQYFLPKSFALATIVVDSLHEVVSKWTSQLALENVAVPEMFKVWAYNA